MVLVAIIAMWEKSLVIFLLTGVCTFLCWKRLDDKRLVEPFAFEKGHDPTSAFALLDNKRWLERNRWWWILKGFHFPAVVFARRFHPFEGIAFDFTDVKETRRLRNWMLLTTTTIQSLARFADVATILSVKSPNGGWVLMDHDYIPAQPNETTLANVAYICLHHPDLNIRNAGDPAIARLRNLLASPESSALIDEIHAALAR